MKITTDKITADNTYELRNQILRPNQTIDDCKYIGDLDEDSLHIGLFSENNLVGIGSIYNQDEQEKKVPGVWRIRGMAIIPEYQGKGLGSTVLKALIDYAESKNATKVWCNARTSAKSFYEKFQMQPEGKEFTIPPIGPHIVFSKHY